MRREAGSGLLEVIAAVAILSVAGVVAVTSVSESIIAAQRAQKVDAEFQAAGAFMEAVALWSRDDLDRRLGDRAQGPWRLKIGRPLRTLYTVILTDTATGRTLIRTSLYRPEPTS